MISEPFRPCILVPTYDNPLTIAQVAHESAAYLHDVLIVDDGSAEPARRVIDALAARGVARVRRCDRNRGKGAAVAVGFAFARELAFTHALQIDGDGQHDLRCIPRVLAAAAANPQALILGYPTFDGSVPALRRSARRITGFWVDVETGGHVIADPMTGFRVYPLAAAVMSGAAGRRMDFDIEIAVRMAWAGVPIVNLPVGVRYLSQQEGGVSHFRMIRDNAQISWLHTRLTIAAVRRRCIHT